MAAGDAVDIPVYRTVARRTWSINSPYQCIEPVHGNVLFPLDNWLRFIHTNLQFRARLPTIRLGSDNLKLRKPELAQGPGPRARKGLGARTGRRMYRWISRTVPRRSTISSKSGFLETIHISPKGERINGDGGASHVRNATTATGSTGNRCCASCASEPGIHAHRVDDHRRDHCDPCRHRPACLHELHPEQSCTDCRRRPCCTGDSIGKPVSTHIVLPGGGRQLANTGDTQHLVNNAWAPPKTRTSSIRLCLTATGYILTATGTACTLTLDEANARTISGSGCGGLSQW
jgi:hypothetical protein